MPLPGRGRAGAINHVRAEAALAAMGKRGSSVKSKQAIWPEGQRKRERGFSLIEFAVVCAVAMTIMAIAIVQMGPSNNTAHADSALRQVVEQIRQAREYSIENRRYVQVQFNAAASGQAQVVITQLNSLTANAGANTVLSTVLIEAPVSYCVCSMGDTPDTYGNGSAIYFENQANGPAGGMLFQSDGELVDGTTYEPINGSVFLGISGKPIYARAVTVLGTTGRVRTYRSNGSAWVRF